MYYVLLCVRRLLTDLDIGIITAIVVTSSLRLK